MAALLHGSRPVLCEKSAEIVHSPVVERFVCEAEAVGMSVVRAGTATLLATVETLVDQPPAINHQPSGGSLLEPDLVAPYSPVGALKGTLVNSNGD